MPYAPERLLSLSEARYSIFSTYLYGVAGCLFPKKKEKRYAQKSAYLQTIRSTKENYFKTRTETGTAGIIS